VSKSFYHFFGIFSKCRTELPNSEECDATGDDSINSAWIITFISLIKGLFCRAKTSPKNRTFATSKKEVKRT